MPAFETLKGYRVVSSPATIDAAMSASNGLALRFAPDDLFVIGERPNVIGDPFAIAEEEVGYVGMWLSRQEFHDHVLPHIDWSLPTDRPALAQGFVAAVPAKLWLTDDKVLLLTNAAYGHELAERVA